MVINMEKYYYTVDFSKVKIYGEVHEVLMDSLNFPDYYGGNLSALYDCLTDMLGDMSFITIKGFENIERKFDDTWIKILDIFKITKHAYNEEYANTFNVTLIHEDGTKEILK